MDTVNPPVAPETAAETDRRPSRRRRLAHIGIVVVALGTVGMLYAGFTPAHSAAANTDPAIEQGRQLFLQGCSSCHGLNAEGGETAPSLIGVGAAAVDFQVGTGRMPLAQHGAQAPQKAVRYTDAQIEQLAAYVASLAPGPPIPTDLDYQSADVAFGGALFRTNCSQCHNFAGSGGALTYGKYAPSLSHATPKQIYEAMITGPESMPVFGDHEISPDQKLAIIKYIKTIQTEPNPGGAGLGRVGPVSETVIAWLVGIGLLVVVTMWIGSRA
jgi:ubiquinol-cytochrome c reductase cytochrome c subunit